MSISLPESLGVLCLPKQGIFTLWHSLSKILSTRNSRWGRVLAWFSRPEVDYDEKISGMGIGLPSCLTAVWGKKKSEAKIPNSLRGN